MPKLLLAIFLGTFVLEDAALAAALVCVAKNQLSSAAAFAACFAGIAVGDLGLYAAGALLAKFGVSQRFPRLGRIRDRLQKAMPTANMGRAIVLSRFLPGTRLPTYVGAGFVGYPFWSFLALTVVTVFAWVMLAFLGGKSLQMFLSQHSLVAVALILVVLHAARNLVPRLRDSWSRKALLQSWRKWLHFEFWPAWLFYVPVAFHYVRLSLQNRSILLPFYANPELPNGGFVGESKWDFLRHLSADSPSTLKTIRLPKHAQAAQLQKLLIERAFEFPFIVKPDVGQRGFGVRIVRNSNDLANYLAHADFDILIQELAVENFEAGVFYYRLPGDEHGKIFSITDKKFPFVTGNGVTRLGDLILADSRARIIADIYFARLRTQLDAAPAAGEVVYLSECGNHCQGAIFENGAELDSPALLDAIETVANRVPGFYFGRFDIKYNSGNELRAGRGFKIVEINGIGSEATHIWDPRTSLGEAYRVLFQQWSLLFAIGKAVRNSPLKSKPPRFFEICGELMRLHRRKSSLEVSS